MNSTDKTRANVLFLLKNYRKDSCDIDILAHELELAAHVTYDEMIGAMNYAHSDDPVVSKGHFSDKTAFIALHYQEKADLINMGEVSDLSERLWRKTALRERLDYFISRLEPQHREMICLHFVKGLSREEIAEMKGYSERNVNKITKQAVDRLCEMYELTRT